MDKELITKKVQALQSKALVLGMGLEFDQSPKIIETQLSDFISEVVDGTSEILKELEEQPKVKMRKCYVRVPHASSKSFYYKSKYGIDVFTARNGRELQGRAKFNLAELTKYGFDKGFDLIEV